MNNVQRSAHALVLLAFSSSSAAVIEEIIVTATKRAQSLQDVPVAVAVMDGVVLDNASINTLDELAFRMPSVMMSEAQAATNIFIRGVGSGQNYGFEQSVGMFIDGAYYSRSRAFRNPFFDVQRVEVLKGPQTVLFGKNVVAGAFNIETRRPTDEWERTVRAAYTPEFDGYEVSGILSGPVSDTVGIRLAARYSEIDGYLDNSLPNTPDPYNREEYLVRGTVEWEATPDLTVTLKGETGKYDITGGYATQPGFLSPAHLALTQAVDPAAEASFDYNVSVPAVGDPLFTGLFNDTDMENLTMTVDWDVLGHTFTSVSSYVAFDFEAKTNNDHTNLTVVAGPQRQESQTFAQEFRITSATGQFLEYIAGAYYSEDRYRTRLQATLDLSQSALFGLGPPFSTMPRLGRNQQFKQDGKTWAVFGEITLNITDDIRLKAGARYTEDRKKVNKRLWYSDASTLENAIPDPAIAAAYNGVIGNEHFLINVKRKTEDVPFAFTGEWDAMDDLMLYAYYKEGFKAGGFDEDFTSGVIEDFEFEDETVKAYAFGGKWTLADGAAYINAEYFHSEFENLQVSTFSVASFLVGNAASATSQGLDVDARWQVNDRLSIGGALVWLDAEYDEYTNGPCVLDDAGNAIAQFCDLSGGQLQYAPDLEFNIFGEYVWPVFSAWEMGLTADLTYSDQFFLAGDLDPDYVQEEYVKLNATLFLNSPDRKYRFSIVGRNLNDEQTSHQKNDIPLANLYGGKGGSAFSDPPRVIALQAEINF